MFESLPIIDSQHFKNDDVVTQVCSFTARSSNLQSFDLNGAALSVENTIKLFDSLRSSASIRSLKQLPLLGFEHLDNPEVKSKFDAIISTAPLLKEVSMEDSAVKLDSE